MAVQNSIHQRTVVYAQKESEALYRDFRIPKQGYTEKQVEQSRETYGSNTIEKRREDTVYYRLRRAFLNPFTMILFALAVVSYITDVVLASNFSRNKTTVFLILSMLVISGLIRFSQEMKSKRAADHVTSLLLSGTTVLREGKWKRIPSSELVVGDQVCFFSGERVPADIRLVQSDHLLVSQGIITGESSILEKQEERIVLKGNSSFEECRNIVFMGSSVMGGTGTGIVLTVGKDTVYGGFSLERSKNKNKFDQGAKSIAKVLLHFMAVLLPIVFVFCGITKGNWIAAFLFALSVAVGLTPEMLPMVVNACLAKGSISMRRKQTVVKDINAMQGFGSMDILCVDKTGTLTGDVTSLEYYMDVLGNESRKVLDFACLNSLYQTNIRNHLDQAILKYQEIPQYASHFRKFTSGYKKTGEVPFDYEKKSAEVLVENETEKLRILKGSVEEICRRCNYVEYRGERYRMEDRNLSSVRAIVDEMAEDGMKVLAVAYEKMEEERGREKEENLTLLGYLAFFDAPRKTAAEAIGKLKSLHVEIRVLTGDQKKVAVSVCRRLGIDTQQILTGTELHALKEEEALRKIEQTTVFAELSPKQKAWVVQALQLNGHTVGFLGDGMNDLPAIAEADVGISVDTAAEAVKESADVLLLKKDLNVLEEGVLEGRKSFFNMSKYIKITASSNFGNIFSIVFASVLLPFFPITSVQLVLLNLLYDTLCLVLPWDYADPEECSHPLEWSGKSLGRFMKFFGPVSSVFDLFTFAFLWFVFCPRICGGSFFSLAGTPLQEQFIAVFQTGWFLESMWTQVLILHLLRTKKISFVQSRPSAPVLLVTTFGIFFFTILTYTPLGRLIGLTGLPVSYFVFLTAVVVVYLLLITQAKKWYVKKYQELL